MSEEKVFFLTDEPQKNLKNDAFGHKFYAHTLLEILEKTESEKSYAIGLFGRWGIGKTSIVNELEAVLKTEGRNHNYEFVQLDAWQYSEQNFRREFLLDLSGKFKLEDRVKKKLTQKKTEERKEVQTIDRQWIKTLAWQTFLFLAMTLISYIMFMTVVWAVSTFLLQTPKNISDTIIQIASLIIAIFVNFSLIFRDNIKDLFLLRRVNYAIEPPVHPDEFKEIFTNDIIKQLNLVNDNDRLVIVLDNLDRVKEDLVIQILSAVKTYLKMEKCIYILACDDQGLKQHIISSRNSGAVNAMTESEANEYLRKFFQTTLIIHNFLTEDLESYVSSVLARMQVFDLPIFNDITRDQSIQKSNREETSLVFRAALSGNPRRIIQLANRFSANYLLAQERSKKDTGIQETVLGNLGFLAKITVIQDEWPHFYKYISSNFDLLRRLSSYFFTENEEVQSVLLNDAFTNLEVRNEWENGLKHFLRRTNSIRSEYISDFILFKQSQKHSSIFNHITFFDAAISFDTLEVRNIIEHEKTNREVAYQSLLDELNLRVGRKEGLVVSSIIQSLIESFDLVPVGVLQEGVANRVCDTLNKTTFFGTTIKEVNLDHLLALMYFTKNNEIKESIISNIILLIHYDTNLEVSKTISTHLLLNSDLLTVKNKEELKERIGAFEDEKYLIVRREFTNKCKDINKALVPQLVPESIYRQNILELAKAGNAGNEALIFLTPYGEFFSTETSRRYILTIREQIAGPETPPSARNQFGLLCIKKILPSKTQPDELLEVAKLLAALYATQNSPKLKYPVAQAYFSILPILSPDGQKSFYKHFLDFTSDLTVWYQR